MLFIFGLLYTVLFFVYIIMALFIVFHLLRYTLNRKTAVLSTSFFLVVFTILLLSNAVLFFSLPLSKILPSSSL